MDTELNFGSLLTRHFWTNMSSEKPLAERMRPLKLEEYKGQEHLVGKNGAIAQSIKRGVVPSMILWGPPGVGKTTLAQILAQSVDVPFYTLSAINSGVKDVREVIKKAESGGMFAQGRPILFIDEIHRFSKSQQDSLLGAVEKGTVSLVGATTENPSFEVISALLSRCQVYTLKPLEKEQLIELIDEAMEIDPIIARKNIKIKEYETLLQLSGGDARKLFNVFELVVNAMEGEDPIEITNDKVYELAQQNIVRYDKDGEQHYDIISAFIKSIRGSDPNAAVYWLARMVEGSEDPKFIARRLIILASEDIGLANPNALLMANNCFQAVNVIGWPESRIILSQCVLYLANSPKGNAAYMAINEAQQTVKNSGNLSVPLHLRNAPTKLMKDLGYGDQYKYAHDHVGNFIEQEFLPEEISGTNFYKAGSSAKEKEFEAQLKKRWKDKY